MFDNLTQRLGRVLDTVRGRGRITEDNVKDTLREVRTALLEADVALPVVREFVEAVRVRAVGQEVLTSLTPGQALVRVVRDELTRLMGSANDELDLKAAPPAVIMVAGLQGSGKTTTVAKLARWLKQRTGKTVLVTSCDVYRPAAIEQLRKLAGDVEAEFYASTVDQKPVKIATDALEYARKALIDVVIVDTAGRMHVDAEMMTEAKDIHAAVKPVETLFVVDSMTGQDAANTAKAFDEALSLTGIVLTKTDGDARGGAALSIRSITGKPIKFLGDGEKTEALQPFHPDRMASRILGMGDVLSLIEETEQKVDKGKAEKLARKLATGKAFGLDDFQEQLREMSKMGGMANLIDKLPGTANLPDNVKSRLDDRELVRLDAIICSMTRQERQFPAIIKGSRKRRIAAGSGTQVQDVNKLLKQFAQMQKMMKRMKKKGGLGRMMQAMKGAGGPQGMSPF
jgi:signal recognition particle subunit SRP54